MTVAIVTEFFLAVGGLLAVVCISGWISLTAAFVLCYTCFLIGVNDLRLCNLL